MSPLKYLAVLKTYLSLAYKVYVVNSKHTSSLFRELERVLGRALDDGIRRRIAFYTIQSFICASWTCALRGYALSKEEIKRIVCLGAITPLVDDLTDQFKLKSEEILGVLKSSTENQKNDQWALAKYLFDQLMVDCPPDFPQLFEEALIAQDASLKQLEKERLSDKELASISRAKGGTFVVLYRAVIEPRLQSGEKEALMTLGYILQQVNDMFDIYKDGQNGQQTLFTNSTDINRNYQDYQKYLSLLMNQFLALGFEKSRIKKCLLEISTVTSRGLVCLDQLTSLQNDSDSFDPRNFSRNQLICDMEKANNLIKSFRYSVQFYDQMAK